MLSPASAPITVAKSPLALAEDGETPNYARCIARASTLMGSLIAGFGHAVASAGDTQVLAIDTTRSRFTKNVSGAKPHAGWARSNERGRFPSRRHYQ